MRFAIERIGVAVVVIAEEILLHHASDRSTATIRPTKSVIRLSEANCSPRLRFSTPRSGSRSSPVQAARSP
jgi:hypothetical protein